MSKRIVFFTKYTEAGASSRYRSFQYFPYYTNEGFDVVCKPLFPSKYVEILYKKGRKQYLLLIPHYIRRFFQVLFLKSYDILYIEYELFPFMPYFIEKFLLKGKKNIIFDYDDAIFHSYDKSPNRVIKKLCGNKIYKLVKHASVVITGNAYLAQVLKKYNSRVIEIPTSVIFKKYHSFIPSPVEKSDQHFRIGWIGSKTTSINIALVTEAIKNLQQKYNAELALIGFDKQQLNLLKGINYKLFEWSAGKEIALINSFDVGIMPLERTDFNNGKCGFKLIQYMACALPTVSTPLQANIAVNRGHKNLHADSAEEWEKCFEKIITNKTYYREEAGKENKEIVCKYYSVETNCQLYINVFKCMLSKAEGTVSKVSEAGFIK